MKRMLFCAVMLAAMGLSCLFGSASASQWGISVGGIHILKTDITGTALEGAQFQLVREVRISELTDQTVEKQVMKIGEENRIMTAESFWINREMTGQRQSMVTTDRQGRAAIYGLPYGTYYLVEVCAPEGYNRITDPIRVPIHKYSHLTAEDQIRDDQGTLIDNTLHIINVRYSLPDTGNLGEIQLMAGGIGVILSSAALILLNRKRWKQ